VTRARRALSVPLHDQRLGSNGRQSVKQRASGDSKVEIDGPTRRSLVSGSFQPLLEAVSGHEVIDLYSVPVENERSSEPRGISL